MTIDVGRFATHVGLELIDGYQGFNDNYSRAMGFGYAGPFTHTGLRASIALSDTISAMAMVANGWDNSQDNNDGKTFGTQVSYAPESGALEMYLNYVGGPEQAGNSGNYRHLADLVTIVHPTQAWTISTDITYGYEDDAVGGTSSSQWFAASMINSVRICDLFGVALRGEYFDDNDGTQTGTAQKLWEVTLTPSLFLGDHAVVRADFRYDRSNQSTFTDNTGTSKNQMTVGLNSVFYF
ncbi:MAG: outer membrane beta-barrel protein [Bdellovibrionota bacterium]